jgi:AsmA protein
LEKEIAMQKRWIKITLAVAALVIIVVGLIPFLINADTFRPKVEIELTSTLGRKVTLGHLSFSLLSGSLVAEEITVADDPAFSTQAFLEAKRLHIGVELAAFLFHHLVRITTFSVDSPTIHLIHTQNGIWNFSSLGSATTRKPATHPQESILPALSVGEINIKSGNVIVSSIPAAGKPLVCSNLNLSLQKFSFQNQFPFQLSIKLPGDGTFQLNGTAGPVAQKDASNTPFHATFQMKHFDPVAGNLIDPSLGYSMVADFNGQLNSNGTDLTSTGKIDAEGLQLARGGSPAPHPVSIDYTISHSLKTRAGQVTDISIHTGSVAAHVNGGYNVTPQALVLDLRLSAPSLPVDQLEELLPAVGIHLPSGSKLRGGTLTANLAMTGPLSAIEIAGPIEIDNTQLSGFDLGSRIQGINPLGGTSGGTAIQQLRAELKATPQSKQFSDIYGSVPQIGTASGSGTVSPAGTLDFQLVAKFSSSSTVGALASSGINLLGGLFGNRSAANNGVPLTITGTASNPSIRADLHSLLKQQTSGQLGNYSNQQKTSPANVLKGLFGK